MFFSVSNLEFGTCVVALGKLMIGKINFPDNSGSWKI